MSSGELVAFDDHPVGETIRARLRLDSGVRARVESADELEILGVVGEGGMGLVHLALDRTLEREVAVKSAREPLSHVQEWLVHEARITSRVQHPGVIPVYGLDFDPQVGHRIVMQRIEGEPLREGVAIRFDDDDSVGDALDTFLRVCEAIEYAHSRDIVHLDIKPSNIMVGKFAEVYVVDWGIAMSLNERDRDSLRVVQDCRETIGTPSYLAPEMLNPGLAPGIGRHTDIYLLGGLLYALCTGRPPRNGRNTAEIFARLLDREPPVFPDEVPRPLRMICERAMADDVDDRYRSVEELRIDVRQYLRRRASHEGARAASNLLAQLEVLEDNEDSNRAHELFGECRFGFVQALRSWPDNDDASQGLERAYTTMAQRLLVVHRYEAAERLIEEGLTALPRASEGYRALVRSIATQRQEHDDRHALTPGREARRQFFLGTGVIAAIVTGSLWFLDHAGILVFSTMTLLVLSVAMTVGANVAWYWKRKDLFPTYATRQVLSGHFAMDAAVIVATVFFLGLSVPLPAALALHLLFFTAGFVVLGFTMDRWLAWGGLVHLPFALAIVADPQRCLLWAALAYPCAAFVHAWVSGREA